jgi:sugar/nucleoside kinase (ribokinase family)
MRSAVVGVVMSLTFLGAGAANAAAATCLGDSVTIIGTSGDDHIVGT